MNRPADRVQTYFEEPGSLTTPGPLGRLVRLLFAFMLLSGLYTMLTDGIGLMSITSAPRSWTLWLFVLVAFHYTPYVMNIGFGKDWRRKPQLFVATAAIALIGLDLAISGTWWAPPLGTFVWAWLVYFSAHLGVSFALAAVLGTPGCEMRSIPQLWTILTGRATREHYCPGLLDRIDRWENRNRRA